MFPMPVCATAPQDSVWLVSDRPQAVLEAVDDLFPGIGGEEGAVDQVSCISLARFEMLKRPFGAAGLDAIELCQFQQVGAPVP